MFYGNFQYRRIMVGIGRDDFWRRIDVGFGWIMVATKNDHKPTVVSTSGANWVDIQVGITTFDGSTLWAYNEHWRRWPDIVNLLLKVCRYLS